MKKLLFLFISLVFLAVSGQSQIVVNLTSATVDPNANAAVDVKIDNFRSMSTMQFSINWDSTAFTFVSISNITPNVSRFDAESISTPGTGLVKQGQVSVAWYDAGGATLANGTTLFRINLRARSNAGCKTGEVKMTAVPTTILFANAALEQLTFTSNAGNLVVNGTNCGGGGGTGSDTILNIIAGTVQAQPNTKVCVPITVKNYNRVTGGGGTFKWNPAVLSFTGIENNVLRGTATNDLNKNAGLLAFTFDDPSRPGTLADGTKIFDLCFNVVGAVGTSSNIDLTQDLTDWQWVFETKPSVTANRTSGRVTVVSTATVPVKLMVDNVNGDEGATVCVDLKVKDFKDVTALQFNIDWDPTQLEYIRQEGFNLPGLMNDLFNKTSDRNLRLSWSSGTGVTLADNASIFKVCFKVLGRCTAQGTAPVAIVPQIVVGIGSLAGAAPFEVTAGSVKTNACGTGGGSCTLVSVKNVSCRGGGDGGINVTVNPTAGCNCVWKKDGVVFQTNQATNCNLVNAPAGTYTLELTCNNVIQCTLTQVITEPVAIVIDGTSTNEACATKGGITINPTGGTPAFTYRWSNNATTKDLTGLSAGSFTVTVTDSKGCTATRSFTITNTPTALDASGTVTSVKCFGETNGAINITPTGGCPDASGAYRYTWSGPTAATGKNPVNLAAGSYSVTVMDNSNPSLSVVRTFTIFGPTATLASTEEITASGGTDGAIKLNIVGGRAPFGVKWTGPTAVPDNGTNPTNLAPGSYTAVITDAGGCVITRTITVAQRGGAISVAGIDVTSNSRYNGFGVSCNGIKNGSIGGSFSGGTGPYTVSYTGTATGTQSLGNTSSFTINNLGAGSYTFRVTDASGASATKVITVTEPQKLTISGNISCANGSLNDGRVNVTPSGGVAPYIYKWSNGNGTPNLEAIVQGSYSLVLDDANGCQASYTARVNDCSADPNDLCYKGLSIITPNGDGANDVFTIKCVNDFNSRLQVYDRYGKSVFEQAAYDNTWQGTDNQGKLLPEASYMWVLLVDFPNGRETFTGTLTLLRD